jgi:phosphotransferase system HPr-like phosphotransfer protein
MTLAATKGTKLDLLASGGDAEELLEAVLHHFRAGSGGAPGG